MSLLRLSSLGGVPVDVPPGSVKVDPLGGEGRSSLERRLTVKVSELDGARARVRELEHALESERLEAQSLRRHLAERDQRLSDAEAGRDKLERELALRTADLNVGAPSLLLLSLHTMYLSSF